MMRCRVGLAAAMVVALSGPWGGPAHAEPPDLAAKAAAALRKQEDLGRAKAAEEVARTALFAALKNDFEGARRDYAKAIAFNGRNEKLVAELAKIKGRKGKPLPADLVQITERRTKALARCAELLAPSATAYAQADASDELASLVQMLSVHGVPVADLVAKLQLVHYEPYLDWRTKTAVAKLEQGWEYVGGAWADPKKVAELDAAHSTWQSPWVFGDEVHEVTSNLPRRMARQVAAHVFAYRQFFLAYFTGEWELTAPRVKLPVIVTRTRKEMEERVRLIEGAPQAPMQAAAFYLLGGGEGNPCFASVEANTSGGQTLTCDFDMLQQTFEHELGHQIAFEYSKASASRTHDSSQEFLWVVEGVASYLPCYDLVGGEWRLVRRPWIGSGEQRAEADLAWCRDNADRIPPLSAFVRQRPDQFLTAANYHVAGALAGYLLEGKDREYRQQYIDLCEAVHRGTADASALERSFPPATLDTIDAEFRAWCKKLEIAPAEK